MGSILLLRKISLGIVIFTLSFTGCNDKTDTSISVKKGDFSGLYTVDYDDYDVQYVWIFAGDTYYILYPAINSEYLNPSKQINYESPTHYYVKADKFYSCGIDINLKATTLEKCQREKYDPKFNIISIDTIIENGNLNYKYQKIVLKNYNSKSDEQIILKKSL